MTQDAYRSFRAICPRKLFSKLIISNIQYSNETCHKKYRRNFPFILSVPNISIDSIWRIINSNINIKQEIQSDWEPKTTTTPQVTDSIKKDILPITQHTLHKQSATKSEQVAVNKKTFKTSELTPKMVEDILGIDYNLLLDSYFYYNSKYSNYFDSYLDELYNIKDILENNSMYKEYKLAFITYAIIIEEEDYIKSPTLYDPNNYDGSIPWNIYPKYTTFISYNLKTETFEKYPRGWIKIYGSHFDDIKTLFNSKNEEILSAFKNEKTR